jgi:Domain of unknown function (DUF4249)
MNVKNLKVSNRLTLFFATVLLLAGCIPDPLEVDSIPKVKPQIVVSSHVIPDQSVVILLTKSFGALDASQDSDPEEVLRQIAVIDATVTISSSNGVDTLALLDNGFYGGSFIDFLPGIDYTLHVDSETLGGVTATTQVKPQITFDELTADLFFDGYDDTLAQVSFAMTDPAEKNYYMINALKVEREELLNNLLNPRDFIKLIDDTDFNGTTYAEAFRVFPREFQSGDTLAVYLSNISKDYYDFIQLRLDNRFSLVEWVSEPVNYPSNVIGGKGFFNLYVPDIRFIILDE